MRRLGALLAGLTLLLVAAVMAAVLSVDREQRRTPRGDGLVAADVDRNTPVPQPAPLAADTDLDRWAAGSPTAPACPNGRCAATGTPS